MTVRRTPARLGLGRSLRAAISGVIMSALLVAGSPPAFADARSGQALGLAASLKAKLFYVSSYGATGVATDDCPAIQAALTAAAVAGAANATGAPPTVVFDAPHYNCKTALTWDPAVESIQGNGATIDASAAVITGPLVTVAQTHQVAQSNAYYPTYKNGMRDLYLLGPGKGSNTDLFYFASDASVFTNRNSRATLENVAASNFRRGFTIGSNAFLMKFSNIELHQMVSCVYFPTDGTISNSGEMITFSHGSCGESDNGATNGNPIKLSFDDFSFDFDTTWLVASYGTIYCHNCHFEVRLSDVSTPPLVANNFNGSTIALQGGDILGGGGSPASGISCWVNTSGNGNVFLDNVSFFNTNLTSNNLACGNGKLRLRNTEAPQFGQNWQVIEGYSVNGTNANQANLMTDGSFELSQVNDLVFISSDTATVTRRLSGTNLSGAVSTDTADFGSQALKLTKVGAAGTAATAMICAPFERAALPGAQSYWAKLGAQTGSVAFTLMYAQIGQVDNNGVPLLGQTSSILSGTTFTLTSSAQAWTSTSQVGGPSAPYRAPDWATHICLQADLTSMNAGSIYIDGVVFNAL